MIYVLKSRGANFRKIGYSENPTKRILEVQTGCPFKLELELTGNGSIVKETYIHSVFADNRREGEWFVIPRKSLPTLHRAVLELTDDECARFLRRKDAPRLDKIDGMYPACPDCGIPTNNGVRCIPCHERVKAQVAAQVFPDPGGRDNDALVNYWERMDYWERFRDEGVTKRTIGSSLNKAVPNSRQSFDQDANGSWGNAVKLVEEYGSN